MVTMENYKECERAKRLMLNIKKAKGQLKEKKSAENVFLNCVRKTILGGGGVGFLRFFFK